MPGFHKTAASLAGTLVLAAAQFISSAAGAQTTGNGSISIIFTLPPLTPTEKANRTPRDSALYETKLADTCALQANFRAEMKRIGFRGASLIDGDTINKDFNADFNERCDRYTGKLRPVLRTSEMPVAQYNL